MGMSLCRRRPARTRSNGSPGGEIDAIRSGPHFVDGGARGQVRLPRRLGLLALPSTGPHLLVGILWWALVKVLGAEKDDLQDQTVVSRLVGRRSWSSLFTIAVVRRRP